MPNAARTRDILLQGRRSGWSVGYDPPRRCPSPRAEGLDPGLGSRWRQSLQVRPGERYLDEGRLPNGALLALRPAERSTSS